MKAGCRDDAQQDLRKANNKYFELPLIAHNGPSAQPLRPLHAMNVRSQSEY